MEKKHLKSLLIILLFTSGLFMVNAIQITDESLKYQISNKSTSSYIRKPQSPLVSAWTQNGIPVCLEHNIQNIMDMCSDGAGGVIIVWVDNRTGNNNLSIYAQRISSTGDILWNPEGVFICATNFYFTNARILAAGGGDAIITWNDHRNGNDDIYAQKIDSYGNPKWDANGIAVCIDNSNQYFPQIISDELGGAIIAWRDERNVHPDVFAQRIDSLGKRKWYPLDGVAICTYPEDQILRGLCIDGVGGAIIVWQDWSSGTANESIYANRVASNGELAWPTEVTISNGTNTWAANPRICSDGVWGAIITWVDNRSGNMDIYAQRIDTNGNYLWNYDGMAICSYSSFKYMSATCPDGYEGAIISWEDYRIDFAGDLYVQRINSTGDPQWDTDGLVVSDDVGIQGYSEIATDGNGGAYIVWREENNYDIYAQYVNSSGSPQWDINGIPICDADGIQGDFWIVGGNSVDIISDGNGGAIIIWNDYREGSDNCDIYASKIDMNGIVITPKIGPEYQVGDDDDDDDDDEEIEFLGPTLLIIGLALAIGVVGVATYLIRKRRKIRE